MNVNAIEKFYTNPILKKGFKFAQTNSALYMAATTLAFSTIVRPISIALTPNTDKEDKKISIAKSIGSAATGFLFMLLFSLPLAKGVGKIDANPEKYLNTNTFKKLKGGCDNIQDSKAYQLATQFFKLGLGFALAYPKAVIQNKIIPKVANYENKKEEESDKPSFKGLEKPISDIINKPAVFNFADKLKNTNFTVGMICLSDILSTLAFIGITNKNKNLDSHQKKVLNTNSALSTLLCILSGCTIDKLLEKPTDNFIKNFKKYNPDLKDFSKYSQGAKIVKTSLIFGLIYYCAIPLISTYFSSKLSKETENHLTSDGK